MQFEILAQKTFFEFIPRAFEEKLNYPSYKRRRILEVELKKSETNTKEKNPILRYTCTYSKHKEHRLDP